MVANKPLEKETAKFFLSRKHDYVLMGRIAQMMETKSLKEDGRGQIGECHNESSVKQERLETYL